MSVTGHVGHMEAGVPANAALRPMIDSREGSKPVSNWMRPQGRPSRTWLNHAQEEKNVSLSDPWRSEIAKGHGVAQRSSVNM